MDYVLMQLPAFEAIVSGVNSHFDFSAEGVLGRFEPTFRRRNPLHAILSCRATSCISTPSKADSSGCMRSTTA